MIQRLKASSFSQDEILQNLISLHTGPIQADVTFGGGCFYKNLPRPEFCSDLAPKKPGVIAADVRDLPFKGSSLRSVMFDPPFLLRTGPGACLKERFGSIVGSMATLWEFYHHAMAEIHRVLAPGGWMVFKCQDGVLSGKNHFTHVEVCNQAQALGFVPVDLFILLAKHRMTDPTHAVQKHARKFHSYFWVFQKPRTRTVRKAVCVKHL